MAKGNDGLSALATLPDVRGFLGSWDELSNQFSEQSTALSREAVSAGLRLLGQSAANAADWMQACGQGSRRIGELTQAAERRVGAATDAAGVWNLELGLLGETAQMAAASGQDAWLALARTQAGMLQSALAQSEQAFEHWMRTANGATSDTHDSAGAAADQPVVPFTPFTSTLPWPAWAAAATQGAQALVNAMAASSLAAMQPPPAETTPVAAAALPAKRRKR